MAAHGYFFPISDHVLTLKDDGTFYRFQVRAAQMHFINIIGSQSEVIPYISRSRWMENADVRPRALGVRSFNRDRCFVCTLHQPPA